MRECERPSPSGPRGIKRNHEQVGFRQWQQNSMCDSLKIPVMDKFLAFARDDVV